MMVAQGGVNSSLVGLSLSLHGTTRAFPSSWRYIVTSLMLFHIKNILEPLNLICFFSLYYRKMYTSSNISSWRINYFLLALRTVEIWHRNLLDGFLPQDIVVLFHYFFCSRIRSQISGAFFSMSLSNGYVQKPEMERSGQYILESFGTNPLMTYPSHPARSTFMQNIPILNFSPFCIW